MEEQEIMYHINNNMPTKDFLEKYLVKLKISYPKHCSFEKLKELAVQKIIARKHDREVDL